MQKRFKYSIIQQRSEVMKFEEFKYERPNVEELEKNYKILLKKIVSAQSADEQIKVFDQLNRLRRNFATMAVLCSIRNSLNTHDEFYEKEQEFFDEYEPIFSSFENQLTKALVNSQFKDELIKRYGKHIFVLSELSLKTFDPIIIEDLQKENKLTTEYRKLIASAQIEFEGKVHNLAQMAPYMQSTDREVRRQAEQKVMGFFKANEEKFDAIYDELVKVRHNMAKKLGFNNFVELAYAKLKRSDYDHMMVKNYRDQVYKEVVPIVRTIIERKKERLGIQDLKSYDLGLEYLTGNATPKGTKDELVAVAKKMYEEMSKETGEFINFMINHNLMDLETRPGKAGGGYCTFIFDYHAPFIFANFNGTQGDVDVLTHEAGHAFQVYSCRDFEIMEYLFPTFEACEIHSMSMEFFAWPWMEGFFKEDVHKYKYSHLAGAITFIPYGVAVDEFQHEVYFNPDMIPAERKAKWREIEKKYLPDKVYEDDLLERGGFWYRQGHIFSSPFYYIDYTLAQVCAFQYWHRNQVNHEEAWQSYYELCKQGGSKSFLELLEVAKLENPFKEGTIKKVMEPIIEWLNNFDHTLLK